MSTFTAVHSSRPLDEPMLGPVHDGAAMSTVARPVTSSSAGGEASHPENRDDPSMRTPTRDSFAAGTSAVRTAPPSNAPDGVPAGTDSQRSSYIEDGQDVAMDESDDDDDDDDGGAGLASENECAETEGGEGPPTKKKKKKKGQRFYCKDFPPCTLSFTRSEHLARHIRKHTGERPFQCHCSRRFSRLDNLRQHAQTVHVNEEIPTDSLAATGTRFQRQVRTDRVRPSTATAGRSRASTVSSQSGHARGHSRNLSTSSVGSTASSINYRDDGRPRPPPLAMATELASRPPLSLDTYRSPPPPPPPDSPGGYSTPTSATFSTGPASPRFSGSLRSPGAPMSPSANFWSGHAPTRRLSVPSGTRPLQSPMAHQHHHHHHHAYGPPPAPPYMSALPSATSSTFSGPNSAFGSPTSSVFSVGHEPVAGHTTSDAGLKRRTWHPESRSTFTSPLANGSVTYAPREYRRPAPHQQPPPPPPPPPPPGPGPAVARPVGPTRLPGIESFDQMPPRPSSPPPRRGPSPMQVDSPSRPPVFAGPMDRSNGGPDNRRRVAEWDMSLHRNLNRLDIHNSTPPTDAHVMPWPAAPDGSMSSAYQPAPECRPAAPPATTTHARAIEYGGSMVHSSVEQQAPPRPPLQPVSSSNSKPPETPRRNKRHGWYNGPITAHRPSPDSSGSEGVATPSTSSVGEANPSIRNSNGWFESEIGVPALESQKVHPSNGFASGSDYSLASAVRPPPITNQVFSTQPRQPAAPPPPSHRDGGGSGSSSSSNGNMLRLEALVAVATSEDK